MQRVRHGVIAALLVIGGAVGAPARTFAQEDYKPDRLVEQADKVCFTDDDRRIAAAFLAEHDELRSAPRSIATALRKSNRWTPACNPYASSVPRQLEQRLSNPPDGFVLRIFDRSLWLLWGNTGEVVDRIDPRDDD